MELTSVGFADPSHIYNEEIQLEREDRGSRNSKTPRAPFVPFCKLLGFFQTLYVCIIWNKLSGSTRALCLPKWMFLVQHVLPSWVTLCNPQSPALVVQMVNIPLIYLSRNASDCLRFCGFISKATFCSCNPSQAKGGAQATRKALNFLTLGGSWGEQEPAQLPGMQLGGRFCTPSSHTGCKPSLTAAHVFTE